MRDEYNVEQIRRSIRHGWWACEFSPKHCRMLDAIVDDPIQINALAQAVNALVQAGDLNLTIAQATENILGE